MEPREQGPLNLRVLRVLRDGPYSLFASPRRCSICVHHSRRRRLFSTVKCWFFTRGRPEKTCKRGPACLPTYHLLRWPVLHLHVLLDAAAAALDARRLQTFTDTGDCATWFIRNPGVESAAARTRSSLQPWTHRRDDTPRDVSRNMQKDMTHKLASTARGRPMLCGATSPSQPALRCRLRQVQRVRDLLVAKASGRHALHGETLVRGSHHVVRRLENTCDLSEMWLVVYGYVIKSVSVRYGKMCCCVISFTPEGIVDQNGLEICCFSPLYRASHFIRQKKRKLKSCCQERRDKREIDISRSPGPAGHLYCHFFKRCILQRF